jgi:uncharacterized protein YndB with AHSA1/START domain
MVAGVSANSGSFTATPQGDAEVVLTRLFAAPRHIVYQAMTRAEHIRRWWGQLGEGYSVPVCEMDLRVGGKWRFVNRHPRGEAAFHGEILEIVPNERLVFTEIFEQFPDVVSVVTSVYSDEGGCTRLTATVRYPSTMVRDMVLGTGMARGAGISYDRLEDVAHELAAGG